MRTRERKAKALLGALVALVMSLALVPAGAALGIGDLQSWTPPSEKSATTVVKDGKTYKYVTSATRKVTESTADVLGISNVTVCPTAGNPFEYQGDAKAIFDSVKMSARFGIYGSDVNQNMNPYTANYFYNVYKMSEGSTDLADPLATALVDQRLNPGAPNTAMTNVADEFGTSPILYYRPDILYGVAQGRNDLTDANGEAISYGAATASVSGYSELVAKIRNNELGEYEGKSLKQEGDENYDPYYVKYDMSSYTKAIVDNLYALAHAAQAVIDRSANTATPKITRYEDPVAIASNYEAYLRGTQYAVLKAIDEKVVDRKKIGIVEKVDVENNAITFMPCFPQGDDSTDYPEFLEAVTDNICDVNSLVDGAGTAKDLMDCDVVYIYGYGGIGEADDELALKDALFTVLKNGGYADEAAYPGVLVSAPKTVIHHGRGGSVENTVLLGALIGYAYPEVINPVYSLAYFYENFYHIKDSRLQDVLGMNIAAMTVPEGVELSLEGYDKVAYDNILSKGIEYYKANKAAIDQAYPKLEATDEMADIPYTFDPIEDADVTVKAKTYTGKSLTFVPTVSYNGNLLAEGVDYEVSGNVKTKAGTYTMKITGIGNFAGEKSQKFTVNKAKQTIKVSTTAKSVKLKKVKKAKQLTSKVKVTAKGTVSYKKVSGSAKLTINKSTGKITVKKGTKKGTYKIRIKVTAKATTNYKSATKTVNVKVQVK